VNAFIPPEEQSSRRARDDSRADARLPVRGRVIALSRQARRGAAGGGSTC
jgi:hypothetical protein